jgi:TRAP-type C4-dicarboxylate transport system permease small subunit
MFPKFDMLQAKLPPLVHRILASLVLLVEIIIFLVVMWYVTEFAWKSAESGRQFQISSTHWPIWPVILMVPLAFGLMLLEMFRLLWVTATGRDTLNQTTEHKGESP